MLRTYHGNDAVREVEKMEGRKLTPEEIKVVHHEGFVSGQYKDTKGITTSGVGQTGQYMGMPFSQVYQLHEDRVRKRIPDYDMLPDFLRAELMQAEYRGDLGGSPRTIQLINAGLYDRAASEFLNNAEYRSSKTPASIKRRMKDVADALRKYKKSLP